MFQPQYAIGIGEHSHFYTLRISRPSYSPGAGPHGNATVNGVYQGTVSVAWNHVQNLSQNPDEAIAKATEAAKAAGIPLVSTSAAELGEKLAEIKRADAATMARRQQVAEANVLAAQAKVASEAAAAMADAHAGYIPAGMPNAGRRIASISFPYACWLLDKRGELEGAPKGVADYVAKHLPTMKPWPADKPEALGAPKERITRLLVQVQRTIPIETDYGSSWLMIAVDEHGHRIKQFCSGAKWAEPGDVCLIAATVKDEEVYNGEHATKVLRVKVLERIPYASPEDPPRLLDAAGILLLAKATRDAIHYRPEDWEKVLELANPAARLPRRIDALAVLAGIDYGCTLLADSAKALHRDLSEVHAAELAAKYGDD